MLIGRIRKKINAGTKGPGGGQALTAILNGADDALIPAGTDPLPGGTPLALTGAPGSVTGVTAWRLSRQTLADTIFRDDAKLGFPASSTNTTTKARLQHRSSSDTTGVKTGSNAKQDDQDGISTVQTEAKSALAYHATPKGLNVGAKGPNAFFVRVLVRTLEVRKLNQDTDSGAVNQPLLSPSDETVDTAKEQRTTTIVGAERYLLEALNALENPVATTNAGRTGLSSHIFLNILTPIQITADDIGYVVRQLFERFQGRMSRLHVVQVEVRMRIRKRDAHNLGGGLSPATPSRFVTLRVVAENPTGYNYVEQHSAQKDKTLLRSISTLTDKGRLDGPANHQQCVRSPVGAAVAVAAFTLVALGLSFTGTCFGEESRSNSSVTDAQYLQYLGYGFWGLEATATLFFVVAVHSIGLRDAPRQTHSINGHS